MSRTSNALHKLGSKSDKFGVRTRIFVMMIKIATSNVRTDALKEHLRYILYRYKYSCLNHESTTDFTCSPVAYVLFLFHHRKLLTGSLCLIRPSLIRQFLAFIWIFGTFLRLTHESPFPHIDWWSQIRCTSMYFVPKLQCRYGGLLTLSW